LYKNADDAKANKEVFHVNGFQVQLDENTLDFDMKKEQERSAQGQGLTPEQIKQMAGGQGETAKEVTTVKALNEKLSAANTAIQGGDFDTAIASLKDAIQMDASRDLLWFKLGDAYRLSAPKQTDPAEKQKRLDAAVEAYQKAVQLRQAVTNDKDPNSAKNLAAYYNNLAEAYAKAGKVDDAVKTVRSGGPDRSYGCGPVLLQIPVLFARTPESGRRHRGLDKLIAADLPGRTPSTEGREHDWQGYG